jgi:hypothetical protein
VPHVGWWPPRLLTCVSIATDGQILLSWLWRKYGTKGLFGSYICNVITLNYICLRLTVIDTKLEIDITLFKLITAVS